MVISDLNVVIFGGQLAGHGSRTDNFRWSTGRFNRRVTVSLTGRVRSGHENLDRFHLCFAFVKVYH